ncbi:TPA: hypothetical protein N0F65_000443 [Lagenidium giganteum]|uniref:Small ribosomal subunit protein mS29 n=1 Tax=Lagenidium giganteum TaxID=4803 RepID=A0AAV2YF83_9STRA|nr:TPA: hypothetical protein N0F65_000443 [Lagenidium giganteum]
MAIRSVVARLQARSVQRYATATQVYGIRAFSTDVINGEVTAVAESTEETANEINTVIAPVSLATATANEKFKFFEITQDMQKKFLAEGINKRVEAAFDLMGHRHTMLRKKTFEIMEYMKNGTYKDRKYPTFVIDGARGCGKTIALQQIVQFARESGWLVLYVPRARAWCTEGPYIMRSPYLEGKYDIDEFGVDLLQKFLQSHKDQLAQIPLRGNYGERYYPASLGAAPKEGAKVDRSGLTLLDLVQNGIADEELACTAVVDLRAELAEVTEFPVLVAVDEFNSLYEDTVFGYEGQTIWPEDISVVDALRDFNEKGLEPERRLKNGVFIAATTENYPSSFKFKHQVNYKSFKTTMGPYSPEELQSVVDYYNHVQFLHDKPTESQLAYFRLMTKAVPLNVFDRASFS